jgi:DNA gyrase subunit B
MADQGRPALEVVLTKLHAGGKFGGDGYKVSGGLHGVGVSVVNALSEWLVAEVYREGNVYRQEYERGVPKADMEVTGKTEETGTTITFLPDADIFEEIDFSVETLVQRLRETAFLTKGLAIVLMDLREGDDRYEFKYDGGIRDFVVYINDSKDPIHKRIVYFESESEDGTVEIAMQWNSSYVESVFSFANNIRTRAGRTSGLQSPADRHAEQVRARQGASEGQGGEPGRRGRARRARSRHLHQAPRPAVRGQTGAELGNPWCAGCDRPEREARRVPRGEPDRRPPGDPEGDRGAKRAPGRPEGAGAHTPQGCARQRVAPREARRLPDAGPR